MRLVVLGVVLLGILAFLSLGGWALAHQSGVVSGGLLTGGRSAAQVFGSGELVQVSPHPAPQFTLPLFSGETFDLRAQRGRPVLINFWASWCAPCKEEAVALQQSWQKYGSQVAFLGVDVWDSDAQAKAFIATYHVTYPTGPDPSGRVAINYGLTGVPETFLISRQGQIVQHFVGPLSESVAAQLLTRLVGS
ncbi:MAG: TlpA family protein disulfide reductase [Chloroflexi bacterium]|nr:TlpA family protein disulfide reductase [Chloroflexota bacterium]